MFPLHQRCLDIWALHVCCYNLIPILSSTSHGQGHQAMVYPGPRYQHTSILLLINLSIKGSALIVWSSDEILTAQSGSPDPPWVKSPSTSDHLSCLYTLPASICLYLPQACGLEWRDNSPSTPLEFGRNQILHPSGSISSQRGGIITLLLSLTYICP